jgi:hypothetical protein
MRPWLTKEDVEALDNGQQVHDEYGNCFYKEADNKYGYTFPVDPSGIESWDWDVEYYTKDELFELLIEE